MGKVVEIVTPDLGGTSTTPGSYVDPATDIESVLAEVLADVVRVDRVSVEDNFFDDLGADSMVMARFCARVRKRADVPSVSMTDIYQHPTIRSLATSFGDPGPAPVEQALAEVLADVVQAERVSVDDHFFDDLGADSMVMARFCARVRKRADVPSVSMTDIYRHSTIRSLAAALTDAAPVPADSSVPAPVRVARPAGTREYVRCGALQLLIFLGYSYLVAFVGIRGYDWISAGSGPVEDYLRAIVVGGAFFIGASVLPIVAKWVLIGRWKPREIRIWSLDYVRFWLVKTLVRANPLVLFFIGSPVYVLYLRALGAKVGRGVVILSKDVPVCTDLLTIGDDTIIRKDALFTGYRAYSGVIQTGPVAIGKDVLVGEASVLDVGTSLGDGSQLGHRSALHAGQAVPAGERWHGSPGQRTDVDYRVVGSVARGSRRRAVNGVLHVLGLLLFYVPLATGGVIVLFAAFPELGALLGPETGAHTGWTFYRDALEISFVLLFGFLLVSLLFVVTVPRLLNLAITPDRVYPLYGFHYSVQRAISRTTNSKLLTGLLGDSSFIVHYLRALGYDLGRVVQTGSNFGTGVKHENPYLTSVGSGTMVADGLQVMNEDYSSTSFRVSRVSIGPRNFLGNGILYPAQARTGDNCLLASKVLVPIDGKIREGVGLLGSPSFEIPRSVERDASFDDLKSEHELAGRLADKNRYNLRTIALVLLVRWLDLFGLTVITMVCLDFADASGALAVAAASVLGVAFTTVYSTLVERINLRFGRLTPQFCSIYEPYFWWHERYWKLLMSPKIFNGTPFKGLIWRVLGVRIGRRVFDDGCDIPERTLVTIGDDATLNAGTWLQCHSQEDGAFKSGHITIGAGCTLGTGAWVHYGATMGDGAVLAPDSFLMKGEEMPENARWGGNPAREMRDNGRAALVSGTGVAAVAAGRTR